MGSEALNMQSRLLDKHTKRSAVDEEAEYSDKLLEVEECPISQSPRPSADLAWTRHQENGHLVSWLDSLVVFARDTPHPTSFVTF